MLSSSQPNKLSVLPQYSLSYFDLHAPESSVGFLAACEFGARWMGFTGSLNATILEEL